MALVETNLYGASYLFGFAAADAPTIAGMVARAAQVKFAPQVNEKATDGEGHVEGVAISKPANRSATLTISGYITDPVAFATVADFTWSSTALPNNTFWMITNPGYNRDKGKYAEVTIEAESYPGITTAAVTPPT